MDIKKCAGCKIFWALVIVGALNWGLIGFFKFDLVARIFGEMSRISRIVYGLVGLAGLIEVVKCFKACKACCKKESTT